MKGYFLILYILTVWRISHMLVWETGPFNIFEKVRQYLGPGFFGSLFLCFYCMSIWISIPGAIWLGDSLVEIILLIPAFSAVAILIESIINLTNTEKTPLYFEEKEEN